MGAVGLALEDRACAEDGREGCAPDAGGLVEREVRDPATFGELYGAHYVAIAGYILRRVGDEHLAEDLAAETFLDA